MDLGLSKQEIFDTVVRGLASQGFKRSTNGEGCVYRGAEGRKCAAGWLIPDELYKPECEGNRVYGAFEKLGIETEHKMLICELQFIHDDPSLIIAPMRERLFDFATQQNLTFPDI